MQLISRRNRGQLVSPFDRFFDDSFWSFPTLFQESGNMFLPKIDLCETEKEVQVVADLPGYDKENIEVTVEDGLLTISGTMHQEQEEQERKYYCKQCSSGSFCRQISLPATAEEAKAECAMKNGKLTVTIPKRKEEEKGKGRTLKIQ